MVRAKVMSGRTLRGHVFLDLDPVGSRLESFFSRIFDIFSVQNYVKDQDFSYLLVTLGQNVNIQVFLGVSSYIVLS
jgi:hypothetical protein